MPPLDLLVYHDFDSIDTHLSVGDDAGEKLGGIFKGLYVTAIGPGIHDGRTTVVLSSENRPGYQPQIKEFVAGKRPPLT